jgi:hypothetical protein
MIAEHEPDTLYAKKGNSQDEQNPETWIFRKRQCIFVAFDLPYLIVATTRNFFVHVICPAALSTP